MVEGEPPDLEGSSEDDDEDTGGRGERDGGKKGIAGRNVVYELKNGRLVEKEEGMRGYEQSLEKRVAKMGL